MQTEPRSPTEIADGSDLEIFDDKDNKAGLEAGLEPRSFEKRKRGAPTPSECARSEAARTVLRGTAADLSEQDEHDVESPTKRPHGDPGADAPMTGRELRELLQGHVMSMRQAWTEVESRVGSVESRVSTVEGRQTQFKGEVESVKGRTKVLERDLSTIRKEHEAGKVKVQELTEEVKNLKVQWDEFQTKESSGERLDKKQDLAHVPHDPWADYIRYLGVIFFLLDPLVDKDQHFLRTPLAPTPTTRSPRPHFNMVSALVLPVLPNNVLPLITRVTPVDAAAT
ncbi:unnamed protein product [Symbiodinium sp. CCMP2456]|nr:unnamed protein product [Symbiodinium sp. CCMP2456]